MSVFNSSQVYGSNSINAWGDGGTSGWFLGSMGQWDYFLKTFCHIQETEISELPENANFPDDPYEAQLYAASGDNVGTVKSLGKPFVRAG